jgi:hypothetical protein
MYPVRELKLLARSIRFRLLPHTFPTQPLQKDDDDNDDSLLLALMTDVDLHLQLPCHNNFPLKSDLKQIGFLLRE